MKKWMYYLVEDDVEPDPLWGKWPLDLLDPQKMSGIINLEGTRFSKSLEAWTDTVSRQGDVLSASFGGWKMEILLKSPLSEINIDQYPVLKTLDYKLDRIAWALDCLNGQFVIWRGEMDSVHLWRKSCKRNSISHSTCNHLDNSVPCCQIQCPPSRRVLTN